MAYKLETIKNINRASVKLLEALDNVKDEMICNNENADDFDSDLWKMFSAFINQALDFCAEVHDISWYTQTGFRPHSDYKK